MLIMYTILLLATFTDLKSYRISNKLILVGFLFGFIFQIMKEGKENIWYYLISSFFILIMFFPLWSCHVLGAGDIKLFSIIALFTGYQKTILILFYALIIGAFLSIFRIMIQNMFKHKKEEKRNKTAIRKTKRNRTKGRVIGKTGRTIKIRFETMVLRNALVKKREAFINMWDRILKKKNTIHFTIPILFATLFENLLKSMWG